MPDHAPTRRLFNAGLLAGLAAPFAVTARASTADAARAAALGMDQLHAILVQRGDDILLAEAPRGPGLDRVANIKSCSKSVLALLLGTAIAKGEIAGLDATLSEVAPELLPSDATPGVSDVTMGELVSLRLGLQGTSGGNYGAWVSSRNWVAYALRQPRLAEDGSRMVYSTGTTHILGAVLAKATGQSLLSLARDRLGQPMGFEVPGWTRDPQGYYFGGNEMALTPRAMLRIAVMMRDGGRFGGAEVIRADWIRASGQAVTRSPFSGLGYGLGWFISDSGWIIARGYGGQVIAAHADRGLGVAITSDPNQPARSEGHFGALMDLLQGPIQNLT